jgi:hypothetical protein
MKVEEAVIVATSRELAGRREVEGATHSQLVHSVSCAGIKIEENRRWNSVGNELHLFDPAVIMTRSPSANGRLWHF